MYASTDLSLLFSFAIDLRLILFLSLDPKLLQSTGQKLRFSGDVHEFGEALQELLSTANVGAMGAMASAAKKRTKLDIIASWLQVVRPGAPSSFLLLVVRPGAPSSVLAPSSDARSP